MDETNANLWAPWRMEYIDQLAKHDQGCFLCRYWNSPADDHEHFVLWRTETCFVVLNRFPYTNGHLLISPGRHKPALEDLDRQELLDLMELTRDSLRVLTHGLSAHGFNVGMNFGQCAGAGLPDHLHVHVVPRWSGDTNFMAVLTKTRVIPEAMDRLHERLCKASVELGLPYQVASK